MAVSVLCLLLTVPWVSLQCVIVEYSDHAHLFSNYLVIISISK